MKLLFRIFKSVMHLGITEKPSKGSISCIYPGYPV